MTDGRINNRDVKTTILAVCYECKKLEESCTDLVWSGDHKKTQGAKRHKWTQMCPKGGNGNVWDKKCPGWD